MSSGFGVLRMTCRVSWSLGHWEGVLHGMGRRDEILVGAHGGTTIGCCGRRWIDRFTLAGVAVSAKVSSYTIEEPGHALVNKHSS